jgi:hypothetical protein
MRLGRPRGFGAVQDALTPRIRFEKSNDFKLRPFNLRLEVVAHWYGPAVCAETSRLIRHIRMRNARPGACT